MKRIKAAIIRALVPLAIIYTLVGCKLIQQDYLKPKEIKNNQVPTNCTATSVYYSPGEYILENNQTKVIYYVNEAFTIDGRDVTFLFSNYKCVNYCPTMLTGTCWVYKSFIGKTNKDINTRFYIFFYLSWFLLYWPVMGLIISAMYTSMIT